MTSVTIPCPVCEKDAVTMNGPDDAGDYVCPHCKAEIRIVVGEENIEIFEIIRKPKEWDSVSNIPCPKCGQLSHCYGWGCGKCCTCFGWEIPQEWLDQLENTDDEV